MPGYTIEIIISKLTKSYSIISLAKLHLVIYFFRKMILAKIWYKTYNDKLLVIIQTYKI